MTPPELIKIKNNPGLLPLQLGQTQISNDHWTYIQIFNINPIILEFNRIKSKFHDLENILKSNENYSREYFNTYNIINNLENKITEQINQINPTYSDSNRPKRGLLNALGSIIKIITGNLDNEDAEKYNQQINYLQENQFKMKSILKNQITLLNTSINNFNEIAKNLTHNQLILESRIIQIENTVKQTLIQQTNNYQYFLTQMILNQITFIYQIIYNTLDKIEIAITFAKLNTLHNSIVNPFQLLQEIKNTAIHLTDVAMPFEPELKNILKLENVINIKAYSVDFTIVFILEIPLVDPKPYQYFQLYSLPIKVNNSYQIILPKSKYVAINEQNYVLIQEACRFINNNEYLCNNLNAVQIHGNLPCEISLIMFNKDISDCLPIPIEIKETQIQKLKPNKWILVIPTEIVVTQSCNKLINKLQLKGTYILNLNKDCEFLINGHILKTHITSQTIDRFELPYLNVNLSRPNHINYNPGPLNLNTINAHKILETQDLLNKQQVNLEQLNQSITVTKTSLWTILLYIFVFIFLLYIIYKKLLIKKIPPKMTSRNLEEDIMI